MDSNKSLMAFIGLAAMGLVTLTVIFGSWFTVDQGNRGVKLRNGAVVGVVEPGLGFKMPMFETVVDMDVRTQKVEFKELAVYSKDIQTALVRATVNYHVNPAKVSDIYSSYGTGYRDSILVPLVYPAVKNTFGQFTAAEIVAQREKVGADIFSALSTSTQNVGMIIDSVQIENVDFSEAFDKANEARALAETGVLTQRQENERVKVLAEQIKTNADAEAYKIRTEADAMAFSIQKQGEAIRNNPALIEKITAERWDGKQCTSFCGMDAKSGASFLIDARK